VSNKLFATGAMKEVKVWKFYECVHVIPQAHQNAVLCLKVLKIMNSAERKFEMMLASASKDKQLKLWSLASLNEN
jgi:hypothetical protein